MFGHCKGHGRARTHFHGQGRGQACRRHGFPIPGRQGNGPVRSTTTETTMARMEKNATIPPVAQCPLCKNHCPLRAPACKNGKAYAAALHTV